MFIYQFLDIFFIVFHTIFTLFCSLGWIWKKTRRANLVLILLTAGSWFGLGLFFGYGIGYCPFTDWHWQVKIKLGHRNIPRSYIKYLADQLTGLDFNPDLVDTVVFIVFGLAVVFSIILNVRDFIVKRRKTAA